MKYIKGDLLEGDWDVAMHCANVHRVMGAGVALALRKKWPIVSQVDDEYEENGNDRLGYSTMAIIPDSKIVVNLYGQVGVGNSGLPLDRNCRYDHLYDAIYRACEKLTMIVSNIKIGVPYKMASDRAGGSWIIVEAILKDIEEKFPVEFVVYQLEEDNGVKSQSSVNIPKDFTLDDLDCDSHISTLEEIQEYRNEKSKDKRMELAYKYQIQYNNLYPEDLEDIILDVNDSLIKTEI